MSRVDSIRVGRPRLKMLTVTFHIHFVHTTSMLLPLLDHQAYNALNTFLSNPPPPTTLGVHEHIVNGISVFL